MANLRALQTKLKGQLPTLKGLGTNIGVNDRAQNFLWRFFSYGFDLYPTFGARHENDPSGASIHYRAEIQLSGDIRAAFNINLTNRLTVLIRLNRDKIFADPLISKCSDFI